jgi:3-isopropylmalate/(R)-2-methylmalate dehydratase small subunit
LVELPPDSHSTLVALGSGAEVTVDLPNQKVKGPGFEASFDIAPATKEQLLAGLDLVGTTLVHEEAIRDYEATWQSFAPLT